MHAAWDAEAATFDQAPDHGLTDPAVRSAWEALLVPRLPAAPSLIADLGCGTGSLSVLLASRGHAVVGVDLSPAMLQRAVAKAADAAAVTAAFVRGDAQHPPLRPGRVDAVVARHVLWALPDPEVALRRWLGLLRPGGTALLVEGRWSTGAGIGRHDLEAMVRRHRRHRGQVEVVPLDDPQLWGGPVDDERYMVVATGGTDDSGRAARSDGHG
jgi:SAM-dependent methyltransferase